MKYEQPVNPAPQAEEMTGHPKGNVPVGTADQRTGHKFGFEPPKVEKKPKKKKK